MIAMGLEVQGSASRGIIFSEKNQNWSSKTDRVQKNFESKIRVREEFEAKVRKTFGGPKGSKLDF